MPYRRKDTVIIVIQEQPVTFFLIHIAVEFHTDFPQFKATHDPLKDICIKQMPSNFKSCILILKKQQSTEFVIETVAILHNHWGTEAGHQTDTL